MIETNERSNDTCYIDTKQVVYGKVCAHCHRRCGNLAGGYATIGGAPLCSRPTEADRPDCYRMVFTKFHPLHDCPQCMVK